MGARGQGAGLPSQFGAGQAIQANALLSRIQCESPMHLRRNADAKLAAQTMLKLGLLRF